MPDFYELSNELECLQRRAREIHAQMVNIDAQIFKAVRNLAIAGAGMNAPLINELEISLEGLKEKRSNLIAEEKIIQRKIGRAQNELN